MRVLFFSFIALTISSVSGEKLNFKDQATVRKVITAIAGGNEKSISKLVKFPLTREYPVPPIKNEKELLKRFDQIFDKKLLKNIKTSSVSLDWSRVGWRGIMYDHGKIWIDELGQIIAINHETEKQKKLRVKLIEEDRNGLHKSLRLYEQPILKKLNKDYKFRVDLISKKERSYRLVLWKKEARESEVPLLVVSEGKLVFEGSGGNHYYIFKGEHKTYTVDVAVITAKEGEGVSLIVTEG